MAAEAAAGILRIETWLLREACAQAGRWRARYGLPFRLSLDVSTTQFLRAELAADLRAALDSGGFPGAALDLEVIEDTLLRDASAVAAAFGAVNALGVGVVLDRFGIGQGSINALRRFRLRALKLDARLDRRRRIGRRRRSSRRSSRWPPRSRFPSPPPASRRRRNARVCRRLGCAEGQGGLFSKPLDAQAAEGILLRGDGSLPSLRPDTVGSTPSAPSP